MDNAVIKILEGLEKTLPATWARNQTPKLTGGIFAAQTLANYDSQGFGPPSAFVGKKVVYEKSTFLKWLEGRLGQRKPGRVGGA